MTQLPILIIGGAGKTGARVNTLLRGRGLTTRPVSRSTEIPFDWNQPGTWPSALEGISAAYITYQPDLAVEGAAEAVAALAGLAREKNLERLVLLSGRGEPGAQRAEEVLQAADVPWTVVRASWFNQNFSEGYLLESVLAGEVALPAGAVAEPFVDANDIAEVVTAALTDPRHAGRLYEVTGPRALTFAEAVAEISHAAGRSIHYRRISSEEFASGLRQAGLTEDLVSLLDELFTVVLDGRNSAVTYGVEEALDRAPRDFSDYARGAAANGAWRI